MSLCESIDTLAMAYLDDELASEVCRVFVFFFFVCFVCPAEVEGARADQALIQTSLVAPRMTDTMRMRLVKSLVVVVLVSSFALCLRRFSLLALLGAAIAAAAAAILVFVGVNVKPESQSSAIAQAAVHQQTRALPLEVQGPRTSDWVRQYAAVAPPEVEAPGGSQLLGARMLPGGINGHDGTLLSYDITVGGRHVVLSLLVIQGVCPEEMQDGEEVDAGGRMVHIIQSNSHNAVTITDANHRGYMFMADELPIADLISLVGRTSLVGPQ